MIYSHNFAVIFINALNFMVMKKVMFLLVILSGAFFSANAMVMQDSVVETSEPVKIEKLSKKERKALEKQKRLICDSLEHIEAVEALKNGSWMFIVEKKHRRKLQPIDKRLNFLFVEDNKQVLYQRGVSGAASGDNHKGGITLPFEVMDDIVMKTDEKGETTVEFKMNGSVFYGRVKLILSAGSAYGEMEVSVSRFGHLVLNGIVAPLDKSALDIGDIFSLVKNKK